jgi:SAM-dependent methyltransferase
MERFNIRDCLSEPLLNVIPSDIDVCYLEKMRQFIKHNIQQSLSKYLQNDFHIGYIGLTGHTLDYITDKNYILSSIDIDSTNNPTYHADITKNNNKIIPDELFDILICTEVLEHTKDPLNAIKELTRIVKQNGYLILSTPYNFRIYGPLPDNFRFTEWFYKDILNDHFEILEMYALENEERKLCPINYFSISKKKEKNVDKSIQKIKGVVFPSGSNVAVEVYESLKHHKDIELLFINSEKHFQTKELFETKYTDCPYLNEEEKLIKYFNYIIEKENISFIMPVTDMAHMFFSEHKKYFNNVKIITSSYETNKICINKLSTYNYLSEFVTCPKIFKDFTDLTYPVFLKPQIGYGSKGCIIIHNIEELMCNYNDDMCVLEYLTGKEFTVDCFTYNNKLLYCSPRERKLTKSGLSIITELIEKNSDLYNVIYQFALKINNNMDFIGGWFFQIKYNKDNEISLLEVSTRIAGASSINRLKNVNLPLLSIYAHLGYPISIIENKIKTINVTKIYKTYVDSAFMKTIDNIYFDLDKTLIVDKKVNIDCIQLIYKYKNKKNIYLITRHKHTIISTLDEYNIHQNLFDDIIHINEEKKSDYIKNNSIIFDDSFKERNEILEDNNIYVFDVSGLLFF